MTFELAKAEQVLIRLPPYPPIVRGWNRLEGRPRTADYSRALRAEVRDALWFLTRQWQFGEFQGEDTGSPIDARIAIRSMPLHHYAVRGQPPTGYDNGVPLETRVECERVPFDLPLQIELSRELFRAVTAAMPALAGQARAHYRAHYPLGAGALEGVVDADTAAMLPLAAHTAIDVGGLLARDHEPALAALPAAFTNAHRDDLRTIVADLREYLQRQYHQPLVKEDVAWTQRFLEYQFAIAADAQDLPQAVLSADSYASGRLDWYDFDVDARVDAQISRPGAALPTVAEEGFSFLPVPVSFGGMPSHRYWEMENRKTEFADLDVHTTEIAKLLLTEFALVFSNDWCVIPYEVAIGSLNEIAWLVVTDDFGEQILVRAAGRGIDDVWQRWAMFALSTNSPSGQADTRLLIPSALTKALEAAPVEKVHFLRDEMANMAWAIERTVPAASGAGMNGYEGTHVDAPRPPSTSKAAVRYVLGTDVPGNWFPFIPVHADGGKRKIQLRRARMPGPDRLTRGKLLGVPSTPYYLNEEEVPRAGKIVTRSWQRARWLDGKTYCWIGRRATTGKGEGSSGLAFDQVEERNVR